MEFFKTITGVIKGGLAGVASLGTTGLVSGVIVPAVGTVAINGISDKNISLSHAVIHSGIGTATLSSATGLLGGAIIGGMYANGFFQTDPSQNEYLNRRNIITVASIAYCFFNLCGGITGNAMIAPTEINNPVPIPSYADFALLDTVGVLLTLPIVIGMLFLVTKPNPVSQPQPTDINPTNNRDSSKLTYTIA